MTWRLWCLGTFLALSTGCPFVGPDVEAQRFDLDGDGVPRPEDCDDDDPEVTTRTFYRDDDGDGFGDSNSPSSRVCEAPDGYVDDRSDCDDANDRVHPGAIEVCDGIDNNCDEVLDGDDPNVEVPVWWPDADQDGFGAAGSDPVSACDAPDGHVADDGDCDDADANRSPAADEQCNGLDDDCNGWVDDDPIDGGHYHPDADGDGFGDEQIDVRACTRPDAHVDNALDCDDSAAAINPLAYEVCDSIDNNCNSLVDAADPFIIDAVRYYEDGDGDGSGNAIRSVRSCSPVAGYVPDRFDCDDADPDIGPGAPERCNGIDDDCDGLVDDDDDDPIDPDSSPPWYTDADGDGYGDPGTTGPASCSLPPGYSANDRDCDDSDALTNEDAQELCDGIDNDCDGDIDNGIPPTWYHDADGDGFGDPSDSQDVCDAPTPQHVLESGDCDDTSVGVNPDELEVCDGVDNDCDTLVDDSDPELNAERAYLDSDGDGYGTGPGVIACTPPPDHAPVTGDCDDADALVSPGAPETCDGIDNDCDGLFDQEDPDVEGSMQYYVDADGDGFGDNDRVVDACFLPPGHTDIGFDCDDNVASTNPVASEVCDGVDNNCDGRVDTEDPLVDLTTERTFYADTDGDGFGDPLAPSSPSCEAPTGFVEAATDCDDSTPQRFPGNPEVCDGLDNDCDGALPASESDADGDGLSTCDGDCDDADAGVGGARSWYADGDGDGFGDPDVAQSACEATGGQVADATDCDDGDDAVYPGAAERCNGEDDDCDSVVPTDELDGDGDGFAVCELDCDDTDGSAYPGGTEMCDGADNDCDGDTDEGWTPDGTTYFRDADGDGFGDFDVRIRRCTRPTGFVIDSTDCDDDPAQCGADCAPNGTEGPVGSASCTDTFDNDCDGDIDDAQPQCQGAPWQDLACNHRVQITTTATGVETQVDAPALIKLDPTRIDYGDTTVGDFRFTTADGTPVPFEVETWNPSFESFVWVKLPAASITGDDVLHLYYDCTDTRAEQPDAVWSDYVAVWHMTPSLTDSSPLGNHLTNDGSTDTLGVSGRARYFDGQGSTHASAGSDPSHNLHGDLTFSAWVNLAEIRTGTWENTLIGRGGNGDSPSVNYAYHFYILDDGRFEAFWERGGGNDTYLTSTAASGITVGDWHQVAMVRRSSPMALRFYYDGARLGSVVNYSQNPNQGGSARLDLGQDPCCTGGGSYALDGSMDEVRISDVPRNEAWFQVQYLSMTDSLFQYSAPE